MVYFDQILRTYACQNCLATGMRNILYLMDNALQSISQAGRGQLVKMLITFEPHGIFESNFAYLFILIVFSHWYAKQC